MADGDLEAPKRPLWRRAERKLILGLALAAALLAGAAITVLSEDGTSQRPDTFYVVPDPLPDGSPGTVLRSRAIADPPAGTLGWSCSTSPTATRAGARR